jgi:hypothetical protein
MAAHAWVVKEAKAAAKAQHASTRVDLRDAAAAEGTVAAIVAINELRRTCPLRRTSTSLQFIHKSYLEFFFARLVLLAAGGPAPLHVRVERTKHALSIPDGRRIQEEPEVLLLLGDHWRRGLEEDVHSDVCRARECLLAVVAASASGSSSSSSAGVPGAMAPIPGGGSASAASELGWAANAATILNWMGEPLVRQPWAGVALQGTDLSQAVLCGTVLADAHLGGSSLARALLSNVDLRGARLPDVEFGERVPLLGHGRLVAGVALGVAPGGDPPGGSGGCRLLAVSGSMDCHVRVWDVHTGAMVGEPLVGHWEAVNCVAMGLCPDTGRLMVVSGGSDGTVRLWDALTGTQVGCARVQLITRVLLWD